MSSRNTDNDGDTTTPSRRPSLFDLLDRLKPKRQEEKPRRSSKQIQIEARRQAERERMGRPLL